MGNEQKQLVDAIGTYLQQNFGGKDAASMRKLFDRYDADRNQRITKTELMQLLKDVDIGNSITRGTWARGIIDKLDSDGDKEISWEEFQTVVS